jgi:hypothetical protein
MKTIGKLRAGILLVLVLVLSSASGMLGGFALSDQAAAPELCAAPAYHQFDFWIGDWDVFDTGGSAKVAHARIKSILDGCVLHEDYQGDDRHKGQSFTIYDATRNLWHQTWVTNRGELLEIEGKLEGGDIVLSGRNQRGALVRGTWRPVHGEVREFATTSTDNGKTWKPWFDLMFRRATNSQ